MTALPELERLAGPLLSAQVLDGQLAFEQLEWLGDSVLDVLAVRWLVHTVPTDVSLEDFGHRHADLVSDRAMLRAADRLTLPPVRRAEHPTRPEDRDSRHRQGDSVEAWIGACWRNGGWPAAADAAMLVALPAAKELLLPVPCATAGLEPELPALRRTAEVLGWDVTDAGWLRLVVSPVPFRRRLVLAGAAAVEHVAAATLLDESPRDDEGELSRARSVRTSGTALGAIARTLLPDAPGFPPSDRYLLALLGAALMDVGPAAAQAIAGSALSRYR